MSWYIFDCTWLEQNNQDSGFFSISNIATWFKSRAQQFFWRLWSTLYIYVYINKYILFIITALSCDDVIQEDYLNS